jgi:hypothetical protein
MECVYRDHAGGLGGRDDRCYTCRFNRADHLDDMATRQERIDAFTHAGVPPAEEPLELLCEDHVGTYVIPFPCQWKNGVWQSVNTSEPIQATVLGWRVR